VYKRQMNFWAKLLGEGPLTRVSTSATAWLTMRSAERHLIF